MKINWRSKWIKFLGGLIAFLIFLFMGLLSGENDPQFLRLVWDPNPETDMSHYEVYFWQGDDTLSWSQTNMFYYETINHSFNADSLISNQYVITYNYIRGGAIAVDSSGLKSSMGLSRFYSYEEFFAPSPPSGIRIIK